MRNTSPTSQNTSSCKVHAVKHLPKRPFTKLKRCSKKFFRRFNFPERRLGRLFSLLKRRKLVSSEKFSLNCVACRSNFLSLPHIKSIITNKNGMNMNTNVVGKPLCRVMMAVAIMLLSLQAMAYDFSYTQGKHFITKSLRVAQIRLR